MNSVVIPNLEWLDILNELVDTGNAWDGAVLHLFKNDYQPSANTLLADLIAADFTGYAPSSAVVWHAAGFLPDGTAVITGDLKVFQTGSPATILNTVYGWYATDTGGTDLLIARRFDTPIVLSAPLQLIEVVPSYPAYLSQ